MNPRGLRIAVEFEARGLRLGRRWVPGTAAIAVLAAAVWTPGPVLGHEAITTELTWTRNVSRIFSIRCVRCHRPGGEAPMSLTTYAEVRPWAKAIKHQVLTKRMPPWGAVKGFGTFRNDPSLSLPEIAVISSWVEGGAPEGDPKYLEPLHDHSARPVESGLAAGRRTVRGTLRLERAIVAVGVRAGSGPGFSWLQLTAHLPDGGVEHLLWLSGPRPLGTQEFWFRKPLDLPGGTRLVCTPAGASADLLVQDSVR